MANASLTLSRSSYLRTPHTSQQTQQKDSKQKQSQTSTHRALTGIENARMIEDFESYTVGNHLPSPPWTNRNTCIGRVVSNEFGGKNLKASSCSNGQISYRSYPFNLPSSLNKMDIIGASKVTSISGNTGTEININHDSSYYQLTFGQSGYIPYIYTTTHIYSSTSLDPGTWYQLKLSVDFIDQTCGLSYRKLGDTNWNIIPDLQNFPHIVTDPSTLDRFELRTDTLSNNGGQIDDVMLIPGGLDIETRQPSAAPSTSSPTDSPTSYPTSSQPTTQPSQAPTAYELLRLIAPLRNQTMRIFDTHRFSVADAFSGTALSFAVTRSGGQALPGFMICDTDGSCTSTPQESTQGTYHLQAKATDSRDNFLTSDFFLTIPNQGVVVDGSLSDKTIPLNKNSRFTQSNIFRDLDNDALTITSSLNGAPLPKEIHFVPSSHTYFIDPFNTTQHFLIKETATDPFGLSESSYFYLNVEEPSSQKNIIMENIIPIVIIGGFFVFACSLIAIFCRGSKSEHQYETPQQAELEGAPSAPPKPIQYATEENGDTTVIAQTGMNVSVNDSNGSNQIPMATAVVLVKDDEAKI